jgi:hypothetical protein
MRKDMPCPTRINAGRALARLVRRAERLSNSALPHAGAGRPGNIALIQSHVGRRPLGAPQKRLQLNDLCRPLDRHRWSPSGFCRRLEDNRVQLAVPALRAISSAKANLIRFG